mgnify:CR=1 FL=1
MWLGGKPPNRSSKVRKLDFSENDSSKLDFDNNEINWPARNRYNILNFSRFSRMSRNQVFFGWPKTRKLFEFHYNISCVIKMTMAIAVFFRDNSNSLSLFWICSIISLLRAWAIVMAGRRLVCHSEIHNFIYLA